MSKIRQLNPQQLVSITFEFNETKKNNVGFSSEKNPEQWLPEIQSRFFSVWNDMVLSLNSHLE